MALANPKLELNLSTARQRIVLVNGNPVEDTSPAYQIGSMLSESPGWIMEETPREGSLLDEFAETSSSSATTATQFVAAVERRCEPLIQERVLTSVKCTSVRQQITSDGSVITFGLLYKTPGNSDEQVLPMAIGN
jgi:hypothetical protein